MKINEPNWTPSYIDPDYNELIELAASYWDTVRILIIDDKYRLPAYNGSIVMASGYGNTHETLCCRLREHFKLKRTPFSYDYILYKKHHAFWINDLTAGIDKLGIEQWIRELSPKNAQIISDLIALSQDCLEHGDS